VRQLSATVVLAVLLLGLGGPVRAQGSLALHEASRPDASGAPDNVVGGALNSNAWLSLDAQYLRRIRVPWPERRILVGVALDLPMLLWIKSGDPDTVRLSVRGSAEVWRAKWFALVVDLQSRLGMQDSVLNTSVGWDFQLTVAPSFSFETWSLSPFVGLRQGIATYVKQGDIVHDAFNGRYPAGVSGVSGPKDGWIAGGNTRVPFGLAFGVDLPSQWALYGSAGLVWTHSALGVGMFDAMMLGQWPFFIDLGVSRRF
jgi:hypothetical protein